jgi:hypothetical protein
MADFGASDSWVQWLITSVVGTLALLGSGAWALDVRSAARAKVLHDEIESVKREYVSERSLTEYFRLRDVSASDKAAHLTLMHTQNQAKNDETLKLVYQIRSDLAALSGLAEEVRELRRARRSTRR